MIQNPESEIAHDVVTEHAARLRGAGHDQVVITFAHFSEDKGFLKLHPEEVSEWDEKVLPFDKLCAAAVPQGKKYLESLQPSIDA